MMLMPRTFLNHIVGCPLIVKATLPLHVGAKRLLSLLGCGADHAQAMNAIAPASIIATPKCCAPT